MYGPIRRSYGRTAGVPVNTPNPLLGRRVVRDPVVEMRKCLVKFWRGPSVGATMFVGALVGARFAVRIGNLWLRRIFLTAVWVLGLKALIFDVWRGQGGAEAVSPSR